MHKLTNPMAFLKRLISFSLIVTFITTNCYVPKAYASMPSMPVAGTRVSLSPPYNPATLKGMVIHPENALRFDFLVDSGDDSLAGQEQKDEYQKLVKYFMAALTVPDQDQWVNLSPYEKTRIVNDNFGKTEMGRDLLAQDYILKQITASLMYPEEGLGRKFWDRVYERAHNELGTDTIPTNTFNKVWILPDSASVYEKGNTVYVVNYHLKVMLEEDYLALSKNSLSAQGVVQTSNPSSLIASKVVKEIIIPELEREVNEGKNFAPLRQVYSGMILAEWYKRSLKESFLSKIYMDKAKVQGVNHDDPKINEEIWKKYVQAFKKGVFNYIKEDVDKYTQAPIPRKYFSGGTVGAGNVPIRTATLEEATDSMSSRSKAMTTVEVMVKSANPASTPTSSAAMLTLKQVKKDFPVEVKAYQNALATKFSGGPAVMSREFIIADPMLSNAPELSFARKDLVSALVTKTSNAETITVLMRELFNELGNSKASDWEEYRMDGVVRQALTAKLDVLSDVEIVDAIKKAHETAAKASGLDQSVPVDFMNRSFYKGDIDNKYYETFFNTLGKLLKIKFDIWWYGARNMKPTSYNHVIQMVRYNISQSAAAALKVDEIKRIGGDPAMSTADNIAIRGLIFVLATGPLVYFAGSLRNAYIEEKRALREGLAGRTSSSNESRLSNGGVTYFKGQQVKIIKATTVQELAQDDTLFSTKGTIEDRGRSLRLLNPGLIGDGILPGTVINTSGTPSKESTLYQSVDEAMTSDLQAQKSRITTVDAVTVAVRLDKKLDNLRGIRGLTRELYDQFRVWQEIVKSRLSSGSVTYENLIPIVDEMSAALSKHFKTTRTPGLRYEPGISQVDSLDIDTAAVRDMFSELGESMIEDHIKGLSDLKQLCLWLVSAEKAEGVEKARLSEKISQYADVLDMQTNLSDVELKKALGKIAKQVRFELQGHGGVSLFYYFNDKDFVSLKLEKRTADGLSSSFTAINAEELISRMWSNVGKGPYDVFLYTSNTLDRSVVLKVQSHEDTLMHVDSKWIPFVRDNSVSNREDALKQANKEADDYIYENPWLQLFPSFNRDVLVQKTYKYLLRHNLGVVTYTKEEILMVERVRDRLKEMTIWEGRKNLQPYLVLSDAATGNELELIQEIAQDYIEVDGSYPRFNMVKELVAGSKDTYKIGIRFGLDMEYVLRSPGRVLSKNKYSNFISSHQIKLTKALFKRLDERLKKQPDAAMNVRNTKNENAPKTSSPERRGGIDLNGANLDLSIKRDGNGVPLPLFEQDMKLLEGLEGLVPIIIDIKPLLSTTILSELRGQEEPAALVANSTT